MVRTKADGCGRKVVAAKAPRKQLGSSSSGSSSSSMTPPSDKGNVGAAGVNPVRWWPTPEWQRGVKDFFGTKEKKDEEQADTYGPSIQLREQNTPGSSTAHPGVSTEEQGIEEQED